MDKVLKTILKVKKDLGGDWREDLENIDIYEYVSPLYETYDNYEANILLCFIVLSCHQESGFLDLKKDRIEDKLRIMTSIAGPSALTIPSFHSAVYERASGPIAQVMDWLFEYQVDWRLSIRDSLATYSSIAFSAAKKITEDNDSKTIKERGEVLKIAMANRKEALALDKEIQDDYAIMNTIASLEGRKSPVEKLKPGGSWENYIQNSRKK